MPLQLPSIAQSLILHAKNQGFTVFSRDLGAPIPFIGLSRRSTDSKALNLHISAGTNGLETSGTLALTQCIESKLFSKDVNLFIAPFLNPSALCAKKRLNPQGIDLRKDYNDPKSSELQAYQEWIDELNPGLDASLLLQEDWEANGAYLVEEKAANTPDIELPLTILNAVQHHCPLDKGNNINGLSGKSGLVQLLSQAPSARHWTQASYLSHRHGCKQCLTLNTPNERPMNSRIAAQKAAIEAAAFSLSGATRLSLAG